MSDSDQLAQLDRRFMDIYEAARAHVIARQMQIALIVIQDDDLLLYRHNHALERFPGLMPPLYNKMKTLGHIPLGVFCLLHRHTGADLPQETLEEVKAYRAALGNAAEALDTREEAKAGYIPAPSEIYTKVTTFLDAIIAEARVSRDALDTFARSVAADIQPVLAAAAHAQLEACDEIMAHIRSDLLTEEQWEGLQVLVLGPYMARQGEIFLQYFAGLLHTPAQGDKRLVYFDGDDLGEALDRLGTTMLDAEASRVIFGDRERLHRDVLADATTRYLRHWPSR